MRKFFTIAGTAVCLAAYSLARAHPGHGDAAHYLVGGPHEAQGAHQLLAQPWFAATLLVASLLVFSITAARARSLKLPRPRRDRSSRSRARD